MKQMIMEFFRRGLIASGFGPLVLAVLYLILQQNGVLETMTVNEVCLGILSLYALAFAAGGMNVIYKSERLPLMAAILIHGGVLYLAYLATYQINGWLEWGIMPIVVFSGIFVLGYLVIWIIIYSITRKRTDRINAQLKQKQLNP